MGKADFKNKDIDNDYFTIHISYKKYGIDCFVHYENSGFFYTSFHLKDLLIDNIQIASLGKEDYILVLKKFHLKNSKEFVIDEKTDSEEVTFYFENLGLTIWYSNDGLSDISIEPIFLLADE